MSKANPKLSLVIPAYNEAGFIDSTLAEIKRYLEKTDLYKTTELVVVAADGGDNTAVLAKRHEQNFSWFKVIEPGKRVGKGRDVREGMLAASGELLIFTDADLATPLKHIEPAIKLLESGNDVVIGQRDLSTMHDTLVRKFGSQASNLLIQLMAAPGIKDTQCGFKAFTKEAAKNLFEKQTVMGWGFDFEILALANKFDYKIASVNIDDWRDPKGDSGLVGDSQISAMIKTLKELVNVRLNFWRGVYK